MKNRMIRYAARAGKGMLELLYPHTCPFCGKVTAEDICGACEKEIVWVTEPRCMKCGKPIRKEAEEYCYDCAHRRHYYDRGFSLWLHQRNVQFSIYRFKYHNRRIFGEFYAKKLAENYESAVRRWKINLIIPIPLYRKRKKQRGYNQSEIIAKRLGKILEIPVDSKSLVRVRSTNPQKRLDVRKRRANLADAFQVRDGFAPVRAVLLIDDIYTTGSTVDYAAKALKRAGVQKVYFLTISVGQGY